MESPSPSYEIGNNYSQFDVFINHRGVDVKKGLATHLYQRLSAHGLTIFLDIEELQAGDNLTPQIKGAIQNASLHIAIFSPRYAESTWCLDELVQMLESKKTIFPVFYKVDPSEPRWTRGRDGVYTRALNIQLFILVSIPLCILLSIPLSVPVSILLCVLLCTWNKNGVYAGALSMLEKKTTFDSRGNKQKPRYNSHTIEKWRNALSVVSKISGFDLNTYNGDEGMLVQKVVEQVCKRIGKTPLNVAKHPTGLDDKVKHFEATVLSQHQSGKTTVVGIVGLGGIGKTTLAKTIFNRHRSNYRHSCFVSDVREKATKKSLHSLQRILLKDLGHSEVQINSTDEGIEEIKKYLSSSSYEGLIVLDDVDHVSQLDALFSPIKHAIHLGSLVLVTSRNKGLLKRSGIVESFIYEQTGLNGQHSQELFCLHAFNNPYPVIGFGQVVEKFLDVCDGLPLSLQVIGALLCHEDLKYWEAQLHKISKILPSDILNTLKISYESLDEEEKQIFLDIACFFIGEDRDTAIRIWDGSSWQGWLGLRNLENKCLVQVDTENRIRVHDHLRDLGRDIAKKETPHRLWCSADNPPYNLADQSYVRGISMVPRNGLEQSFEIPTNMSGLQLLRAESNSVQSIFSVAQSPQLVWLSWSSCPFSTLPSWVSLGNLRVLYIKRENWKRCGNKNLSANVIYTGGELETLWQHESQAPLQLRELIIDANLFNVPKSIGNLKHLEKFVLRWNKYIGSVWGNPVDLETLPDEVCGMHSLKHLELESCENMKLLPDSVGYWTNLQHINLCGCSALQGLPDSTGNWTNLQHIDLGGCSALQGLPDSAGNWTNLQDIDLEGCSTLQRLPDSTGNWTNLQYIFWRDCHALEGLPDSAGKWTNLQDIYLAKCYALQGLPDSAGNWTNLQDIFLSGCLALQELPDSAGNWTNLQHFNLSGCPALQRLPDSTGKWMNLQDINLEECPALQGLPDSAGRWTNLQSIDLCDCSALQGLPDSAGNWKNLQHINLGRCSALKGLPASAGNWKNLQRINLSGCSALKGLPASAGNWKNLQRINLSGCSLKGLPNSALEGKDFHMYLEGRDLHEFSNLQWTEEAMEQKLWRTAELRRTVELWCGSLFVDPQAFAPPTSSTSAPGSGADLPSRAFRRFCVLRRPFPAFLRRGYNGTHHANLRCAFRRFRVAFLRRGYIREGVYIRDCYRQERMLGRDALAEKWWSLVGVEGAASQNPLERMQDLQKSSVGVLRQNPLLPKQF